MYETTNSLFFLLLPPSLAENYLQNQTPIVALSHDGVLLCTSCPVPGTHVPGTLVPGTPNAK